MSLASAPSHACQAHKNPSVPETIIMFSRRSLLEVLILLLLLGSPALSLSAAAQNPSGGSGVYDSLVIGVDDKSGVVTGYFEEGTGWDERTKSPMFLCTFFLYGKLQGDSYPITTWYPGASESIKGQLKFMSVDGFMNSYINLDDEPGGCAMAHPFSKDGGSDLRLDNPGKWSSVRGVATARAYFHKAPDARTREKSFVVKNDAVRVFKTENGWVEAEFGTDKVVRGWLKEADLS